jgi:hypothetical protein
VLPSATQAFALAAAAGELAVAGTLAGIGLARGDGGFPGDGAQVPVAWPVRLPDCLSSGVRPAEEARWAGAESGHVHTGLGEGVLGGAATRAGHRLGLLQLLLIRGSAAPR